MLELTTSVVFLMSSLYGSGNTSNQIAALANQANTNNTIVKESTVEITGSLLDAKTIEMYVRSKYVNEPILIDIARCESSFHQFDKKGNVIRGQVNKDDIGVMQINENYHADLAQKLGYNIYTLQGNVAFAQ